jgi:hypothetical protein
MKTRGVYFLANDRILDLTIAFLNSFRKYNPGLPLCLIPFRDDFQRLAELSDDYQFTIFNDENLLKQCDRISLLFHAEVTGHYRKLACWHGCFDEFIYVDVDMLVLKDLSFSFDLLPRYDFITSCANIPEAVQWVWKPTIHHTRLLSPSQIEYGANTGYIISKKDAIPLGTLEQRALNATSLKNHMELYCKEQPFLNFLIVTSGLPFTSLWAVANTPEFPQNYTEFWAGNGKKQLLPQMHTLVSGQKREVYLIHWAGVWQPKYWEIKLFGILNRFKLVRKIWTISLTMPLRRLWKRYRKMNPPTGES